MRNVALIRCLRLMRRLEGCRVRPDLEALATEYHVSTRTIRRDLIALSEAGVPVPKGYNPSREAA